MSYVSRLIENGRKDGVGLDSGIRVEENRALPRGRAYRLENTIHVPCLYRFAFISLEFGDALDFSCDRATGLISDHIDALIRKHLQ